MSGYRTSLSSVMRNRQYWRTATFTSRKQHKVISWKIQWYWPVGAESAIHLKAKGNDVGAAVWNFEREEISFFTFFNFPNIRQSALYKSSQTPFSVYILASRSLSQAPPSWWHHASCDRQEAMVHQWPSCSVSCSVSSWHKLTPV